MSRCIILIKPLSFFSDLNMEQDSRCLSIESDTDDMLSEATQNIATGNESWEDSVTLPTGSSSTLPVSLARLKIFG